VNLLAHALLAGDSDESVLGNLAADFLRPADVERLQPAIRTGVMMHRHVDAFTDRHPVVQRSIARIGRDWGWFSGILIDVYYDHVLAAGWAEFAPTPLREFVDRVHTAVAARAGELPEPARGYFDRMVRSDRLMSYAELTGIERALAGLSLRIAERMPQRAVRLQDAVPALRAAHAELAADFREFFPQVRAFAADWRPETPAARGSSPRAAASNPGGTT
jgi:acyl carrier protein phosphodiesterase